MKLQELSLPGVYLVELQPHVDERGWFVRTFDEEAFGAAGLETRFAQRSAAWNRRRGTLRGLHWQAPPHGEVKLLRCGRGALFDVALDVRPSSPTFGRWLSVELRAGDLKALYLPAEVAHGYLTLEDDTEVLYDIAGAYQPASARGVRFDDPALGIRWPFDDEPLLSARDRALPTLAEAVGEARR